MDVQSIFKKGCVCLDEAKLGKKADVIYNAYKNRIINRIIMTA